MQFSTQRIITRCPTEGDCQNPSIPLSAPSLPFFPSTSILHFFEHTARERQVLHQLSQPLAQHSGRTPPSYFSSLSPLSLSVALAHSLSLSSPCCDRAHLLDLGYTRSESNYLIGPCSHFTVSSPPTGFLGVKLISAVFALLLLRTGRLNL